MKVERGVLSNKKVAVYVCSANYFRRTCIAERMRVHVVAITCYYVAYEILKIYTVLRNFTNLELELRVEEQFATRF